MRNPILSVLSIKSFSFLMLSELCSQIAMNLLNFVLLILVFNMVRSSIAVSGVILAFTIPALLFGILAGIYVDRWEKKHVLFYTNVLRALFVIPLFFLNTNLFAIYSITFAVSLVTQFFIPAEAPMIPLIVRKELLLSANALFSMGIFASILIAYAISGPFLLFFGESNGFIVISIFFLLSSLFAYLIKTMRKERAPAGERRAITSMKKDLLNTLYLLRKLKKISQALFILTFLQTLILTIAVVGPGFAEDILGIRVEEFPVLFIAPAVVGIGFAAFVLGNYFHKSSRKKMVRLGLFIMGAILLISPYASSYRGYNLLHIMAIMSFIMGIAFALIFIPSNTVLQEESTDEMRGKVYGFLNTLVGGVSIIPVLAVVSIADAFGVAKVLSVMGIIILVISQFRLSLK
ncbi:MAG: major facilitator superfamily [Candidatus Levybacteria bacterium GW2011_GWC2_40_7]|nr:MAG: major facilitator superfamily [Candidatus Levybacteria bacterium GW2011_GWC2_40_7]